MKKKQITRENEKLEGQKVFQLVSLSLNRFPDGKKYQMDHIYSNIPLNFLQLLWKNITIEKELKKIRAISSSITKTWSLLVFVRQNMNQYNIL